MILSWPIDIANSLRISVDRDAGEPTSSFSSSPSLPSFPAALFCAANCSSTRASRSCSCEPAGMIGCGGGDGPDEAAAEGPPPRLGRFRRRFGVEIPVAAAPRFTWESNYNR